MLADTMRSGFAYDLLGIVNRACEIVVASRGRESVEKSSDPFEAFQGG